MSGLFSLSYIKHIKYNMVDVVTTSSHCDKQDFIKYNAMSTTFVRSTLVSIHLWRSQELSDIDTDSTITSPAIDIFRGMSDTLDT